MAPLTLPKKANTSWLKKACLYLDNLFKEAVNYQDEDDIVPTQEAIKSAKNIMKLAQHAEQPEIAFSVNGEVVLTWRVRSGNLTAWCNADGHVDCYKKNDLIDSTQLVKAVNNTMAA
jgi:hypothetical protein